MRLLEGRTHVGRAGTVVEILQEGKPEFPDWQATLALWFCICPGQSPAWDRYLLSIIHLRPIEGVPPAHIRVPGSTHEVLLVALDPALDPSPTDVRSWLHLTPVNVMEQITLPSDDDARELLERAAMAVAEGVLPAEPMLSGQREPWQSALLKTAAHARGEEHAP